MRASLALALATAFLLSGCGSSKRTQLAVRGRLLGTLYHVTLVGPAAPDRDGHRELSQSLQTRLAQIITATSADISYSEISRLNAAPAGTPVPISAEALDLLMLAKSVAQQSQGAFDVTIQPLQAVWGVKAENQKLRPPGSAELQAAVQRTGLDKLDIDAESSTVIKRSPGVTVDLSSVVHGYAADQLSGVLVERGWMDHVVQVGEEITTRGSDRLGRPWRISIQRAGGAAQSGQIPISGQAVAVAGNSDWLTGPDGRLYSRHIDPRTARPLEHNVLSATVICEKGSEADAYAQALLVLGEDDGLRLAREQGLAALLLVQSEGSIREAATPQLEQIIAPQRRARAGGQDALAALRR